MLKQAAGYDYKSSYKPPVYKAPRKGDGPKPGDFGADSLSDNFFVKYGFKGPSQEELEGKYGGPGAASAIFKSLAKPEGSAAAGVGAMLFDAESCSEEDVDFGEAAMM